MTPSVVFPTSKSGRRRLMSEVWGMISYWGEYALVFLLRPLLAIVFVFSLIAFSWFVAWKTVLVHVPLVQEIFGLKKKSVTPKPHARHRLSRFYNAAAESSRTTGKG
ncbi:hypothetical protein ZOSMA_78G00600 [Zostera marina]|uniref:Uncharacterized protein n=1 Tax=Zostera marina TaxID=29655 RepID=A0A0K9NQP3_ZOSMR|nr:hypothetical protein ZOSMA_78G00600 [Zostera marina]